MTSAESTIKIDGTNRYKTEYAYDHAGRRIRKQVYTNNDSGWVLSRTHKFFYDTVTLDGASSDFGLLTEEEITNHATSSTRTYQYIWGPDLNGSYHGLGGVGGLVAVVDKVDNKIYLPLMDAKGTVYKYINTNLGIVVAEFDYDPYGRIMRRSGDQVANLSLRYQTKYHDVETNTYYYGVRHYDPATCRWLSRDPLEEEGGYNLYAFVNNDSVNNVDYLGMWSWDDDWLETSLDVFTPAGLFTKSGRAAMKSFYINSGGKQAKEMWGGMKVITQGDANVARKQMVKDTADIYAQRILMHHATNGGNLNAAINSATGWQMVGSDLVGFTDLGEAYDGRSTFNAFQIKGAQRGLKFFMGAGKFTGSVAFLGGSTMSLAKGWQGTGFAQTWKWATTFKHGGKTYNLIPRAVKPRTSFYVTSEGIAIPATGYRAIVGESALQAAKTGSIMPKSETTYLTFNNISQMTPEEIQSILQLKYTPLGVAKFDTLQIIDDINIPMGKWNTTNIPEPITKTFPNFGIGGGTQAITKTPIKIYTFKEF